ncbi:MAG: NAD(P)/FAD-dependent oxidoreductase, partial [Terriglobia bacterium]
IWERDRFPRDKVCGEFLSPESLPLLMRRIPASLKRGAPVLRAEFHSRRGRCLSLQLPTAGLGLSRGVLDEALWHAAADAGARCTPGEPIAGVKRCTNGAVGRYVWQIRSASGPECLSRRLLVACGRWWKLQGIESPASSAGRTFRGEWAGIKAHFEGISRRDSVEVYFFPGGYCGLAPIEDGRYNACCLVHRSLTRSAGGSGLQDFSAWIDRVAAHPALKSRLRGAIQVSATLTTAPAHPARRDAERGGVLFAGDSAGFLDPFTGDGISMALHSGRMAVDAIAGGSSQGSSRYPQRLAAAVGHSYLAAGLVRALVRSPDGVQDWVAATMPFWLGKRLLANTRWREEPSLAYTRTPGFPLLRE